jgi:glutamine---fructose-6-phosphate transaminase (isomerizing)
MDRCAPARARLRALLDTPRRVRVTGPVSRTSDEIASQPGTWRRALADVDAVVAALPPPKARALLIGCGTSAFIAQSAAQLREQAGAGETHWAYASELPPERGYEHVVAFTRSGTTTEVLEALGGPLAGARRVAVTAVPTAPVHAVSDAVVDVSYADESSVVQTRFPTAVLAVWRAVLGDDLEPALLDLEQVLAAPSPVAAGDFDHFVFLGRGPTVGLAHEAALKIRECAQAWSESCPALDYRHGPIAAAGPRSLVVSLGGVDDELLSDVRATGATVLDPPVDPLARLVVCQRIAVELAAARGLDPDTPRHLSRSVVLSASTPKEIS